MRGRIRMLLGAMVALPAVLGLGSSSPALAGGSCFLPASSGDGVRVALQEQCFAPTVLRVAPGTTVTWTNRDPEAHTVTGLGVGWGTAQPMSQGDIVTYRFTAPGVYPYACVIHYGMVGAVVVGRSSANASVAESAPTLVLGTPVPAAPDPHVSVAARPVDVAADPRTAAWRAAAIGSWATLAALGIVVAVSRRRRHSGAAPTES
jgi:plastocyanin